MKRILSFILALCMILAFAPAQVRAENELPDQQGFPTAEDFPSEQEETPEDGFEEEPEIPEPEIGEEPVSPDALPVTDGAQSVVAEGTCGDDLTWTLDDSGVLTISGTGEMTNYSWNGRPWDSYRSSIHTILIESGVMSIGNYAFYGCNRVMNVTISEGVTNIGHSSFDSCTSLTDAMIPESVTSIGNSAFNCTKLTNVTIPDGVICIEESTFSGCSSLTSVTLPESLTSIGNLAFSYCSSLMNVTIPEGITSIGDGAFRSCTSMTSVTIPESVTTIGQYTFDSCTRLANISIPAGVTSIGISAFNKCTGLSDVYYGGNEGQWGQITIGSNNEALLNATIHYHSVVAEGTCGDDLTWTLDSSGVLTIRGTGAMTDYSWNNNNYSPWYSYRGSIQTVVFEDGVTSIGTHAFHECLSLTSVTIPEGVTSIGYEAFYGCDNLSDVIYSGSVEQWNQISIDSSNEPLLNATIHFQYLNKQFTMGEDTFLFNNTISDFGSPGYWISDEHLSIFYSKLSPLMRFYLRYIKMPIAMPKDKFEGSCFGISSVMALMYHSLLTVGQYQVGASSIKDYSAPKFNEKLKSLINYYFALQMVNEIKCHDQKTTQQDLSRELIDSLLQAKGPVIVNLEFQESGIKKQHSVLAFSVDANNDSDYFLVRIADPNCLAFYNVNSGERVFNRAADAAILRINKSTMLPHTLTTYSEYLAETGSVRTVQYTISHLISVISDLSIFDLYNPENEQPSTSSISLQYSLLDTNSSSFTVYANGRHAVIKNGEYVSGDLEIYKVHSGMHGEDESEIANFMIEASGEYEIINADQEEATTVSVLFGNEEDMFCSAETNAGSIVFRSNGETEISGATGNSSLRTSVDTVYDSVFGLSVDVQAENVKISTEDGYCKISSSCELGTITVSAENDWNTISMETAVSASEVFLYENSNSEDITVLTLTDENDSILADAPIAYSVVFYSQGGTFVDAVTSIPAKTIISEPEQPIREGYQFMGWYTTPDCTDNQKFDFEQDAVVCDLILYAKWVEKTSEGDFGENLFWALDEGGITISGSGEMPDFTFDSEQGSSAPWGAYLKDIQTVVVEPGVTKIGKNAFRGCSAMTSVTLPETVTIIDDNAFRACDVLASVNLPSGLTSIGAYAFAYCYALPSIQIPEGVTSIGDHAFHVCRQLAQIEIPSTVTEIAANTFYSCIALTKVTIPETVVSIGAHAFGKCTALADVYYDGTQAQWDLITIGTGNGPLLNAAIHYNGSTIGGACGEGMTWTLDADGVFTIHGEGYMPDFYWNNEEGHQMVPWYALCQDIQSVVVESGITNIGDYAFYGCENLQSVELPDSLLRIGDYAFTSCRSLTSVTIPESVTSIRIYAFAGCSSLTSVTIPESATRIGNWAFDDCTSLTSIEVADSNPNYCSVDGVLFDKEIDVLIRYPEGKQEAEYAIPDGVTSIGSYAFYYCRSLTDVTIPESVTSIGSFAFEFCTSLTSMTIPESVTRIESGMFYRCASLMSVTIPESVTSIGDHAFYICSALADVWYAGTQAQWDAITIGASNDPLLSAALHVTEPVIVPPTYVEQPQSVEVTEGETATFTVVAEGTDLQYQWYRKPASSTWSKLSGETEPTLTVTAAAKQNGYQYRCRITNTVGSVYSGQATLTVLAIQDDDDEPGFGKLYGVPEEPQDEILETVF